MVMLWTGSLETLHHGLSLFRWLTRFSTMSALSFNLDTWQSSKAENNALRLSVWTQLHYTNNRSPSFPAGISSAPPPGVTGLNHGGPNILTSGHPTEFRFFLFLVQLRGNCKNKTGSVGCMVPAESVSGSLTLCLKKKTGLKTVNSVLNTYIQSGFYFEIPVSNWVVALLWMDKCWSW